MSYRIEIDEGALEEFARLPAKVQDRVKRRIDRLAEEPRPPDRRALHGLLLRGLWRVRVGDYRISYRVQDATKVVTLAEIGHRRDIYDRLERRRQ